MSEISTGDALRILHAAEQVALRDPDGNELPLMVTGEHADGLEGFAPRFAVSVGMTLTTRVVSPDGEPWALRFVIDEATIASPDTAAVRLRLERCQLDPFRRLAPRLHTGGAAWLIAVNCQQVVDGDRVDGTIQDISVSGVGFTSSRVLRVGDRLRFHGRFFSDEVEGEVRVATVRPSSIADRSIYGCQFIQLSDESRARVERLLRGERAPSADLSLIRSLLEEQRESPRKRRFFR
jgi:hypothetical protein